MRGEKKNIFNIGHTGYPKMRNFAPILKMCAIFFPTLIRAVLVFSKSKRSKKIETVNVSKKFFFYKLVDAKPKSHKAI